MRGRKLLYFSILTGLLFAMTAASAFAASSEGGGSGGLLWLLVGGGALAAIGAQQMGSGDKTDGKLAYQRAKLSEMGGPSAGAAQDVVVKVFAPLAARPRTEILVQVFLHVPEAAAEARAISLSADPSSSELASSPLALQLKRHDLIKVSLEANGVEISEPVQSLHWNSTLIDFSFEAMLPDLSEETLVRFKLRVSANGVPAGTTYFNVKVGAESKPVALLEQKAQIYKRPFLSYSSHDRTQVLRAAQLIRALKMEFFQDVLTLEPGDHWQPRLFSEIDRCDVFLLFWSANARDSQWVMNETEYALRRSKTNPIEIVPVLLEGPPPPLPPPSLQEIHFNDALQYVIFAAESSAKARLISNLRKQWFMKYLINNYLYVPLLILACILLVMVLPR